MKKYKSIVNRVNSFEEKYGITYAKTDGRLYKMVKVLYTLVFIYAMAIKFLYFAGVALWYADTDMSASVKKMVISIAVCTAVFIAGYVLLCTKLKITGGIVSIVSLPYMLWCFAKSMEDVLGLWGYKPSFYWRHLIPLALLFLFALIMTVIAVRQRVIFNKEYNRITENLYEIYRTSGEFEGEDLAVSDEKWEEFLQNYDLSKSANKKKEKSKAPVEKE